MIIDQGVLDDSLRFFHEADPFTKENLFYIERAGIYHCDSTYQFAREASEIRTCQMILVEEGCLQMQYGGEQKEMCPGDMILMHLGEPHLYRTAGGPAIPQRGNGPKSHPAVSCRTCTDHPGMFF